MKIPKVEFEVYYKLNGINLIKLNITDYCKNCKIVISVPAHINKNEIDKYNASSGYYNDICYTTTSDSGTDIILNDRKNEFLDNNMTICQDNCLFSAMNYSNNRAKCSCDVMMSSSKFEDMKINKEKLFQNFIDIKNIANIQLLICYNVLFSKIRLIKNYGSYSILFIILIHFIIIIIYYSKNLYNKILFKINEILFSINNMEILNITTFQEDSKQEILLKNKYKKEKIKKNLEQKSKKFNHKKAIHLKKVKFNQKIDYIDNPPIKKRIKNMISKNLIKKAKNLNQPSVETMGFYKEGNEFKNNTDNKTKDKIIKQIKKIMAYNDTELNNLEYILARRFDKRKYCQYYFSLLKTKHAFIFTFCNNNDYNLKIIKIDLFLFNFALFYIINALFFNDDTMHKIYKNKGNFDIIGQLPQIIYSTIISSLFGFILEMLALTEDTILQLKKIRIKNVLNKIFVNLVKKIKIKLLLYFIVIIIFLIFFWYYLSMFCAIYINTQIHLIKDTLLSFVLSFIEPLAIYLIPGIFRIPTLSKQRKNMSYLYRFSVFLQNILI